MDDPLTNKEAYYAQRASWTREVGRFVLAFGDIEYAVCQCLVHVPVANEYECIKHEDFKARVSRAIEFVQQRITKDSIRRPLVNALNRALKLAHDRNLLAHNPLHLAICTDESRQLDFRLEIMSMRDPSRFVTFSELIVLGGIAEELAADLDTGLRGAMDWIEPLAEGDFEQTLDVRAR